MTGYINRNTSGALSFVVHCTSLNKMVEYATILLVAVMNGCQCECC